MHHHHLIGPLWGNVIIIAFASAITIACFAALFWMLIRPGETDPRHPKYDILRDDACGDNGCDKEGR